jgi:DNA-binding response OmpR family regulator
MNKTRILVVEDQPDIATMLRIYFNSQGYEVDIATRGTEALQKTRLQLPHLILLDIMMPEMDGYEVCRRLRNTQRSKHIPIIFLTQKDDRSDKIAGLQLGADDFITKPFDIEELKLRVQNTLRLSQENNLRDPRTGLPSGSLLEDELRAMIRTDKWAYLTFGASCEKS